MKALFLTPTSLNEYNGINKKVLSQYEALKKNGLDIEICYIDRRKNIVGRKIYPQNIILKKIETKNKMLKKINNILLNWSFKDIENYIFQNGVEIIYIRYEFSSNYGFIKFLKNLKKKNIKILIEIPTYPYDQELLNGSILSKFKYYIDKHYRKNLKKYIDKIVTFSNDKEIYGVSTINISNGIDLKKISFLEKTKSKKIRFIGVAGLAYWHGFDRIILSINEYYKNKPKQELIFNIVGDGDKKYVNELKKLVKDNKLQNYVTFHGFKSGEELDKIYNNSDIAVGSLGVHRLSLKSIQTLKNREYCAKGLPFIIGSDDPDFRDKEYVYEVSSNENLIDMEKIIKWYINLKVSSNEIREYSKQFSWDIQMKKVLDEIEGE